MTKLRRISVRGIIYRDGKVFAQQLKGGRDYWCTPGGGVEDGEPLLEALHREMVEETGIAPKIGRLLFVQQYSDDELEYLEFFFHIENAENYHTIDLASTSHGPIEVEHCEFVDPAVVNLLPAPLQTMDYEKFTSSVQPVVIMNQFGE